MFNTLIISILFSLILGNAYGNTDEKNPIVVMKTTRGPIEIELFKKKAPVTVKNFLGYVKEGSYNGTIFHRIIKDFIIQGGHYDVKLTPRKRKMPIINEASNGLRNTKGTLSMSRRVGKDTATNQFFINVRDNKVLNHVDKTDQGYGYAVFGKIIKGYDIMEKLNKAPTRRKGVFPKLPLKNIVIDSIELKSK